MQNDRQFLFSSVLLDQKSTRISIDMHIAIGWNLSWIFFSYFLKKEKATGYKMYLTIFKICIYCYCWAKNPLSCPRYLQGWWRIFFEIFNCSTEVGLIWFDIRCCSFFKMQRLFSTFGEQREYRQGNCCVKKQSVKRNQKTISCHALLLWTTSILVQVQHFLCTPTHLRHPLGDNYQ